MAGLVPCTNGGQTLSSLNDIDSHLRSGTLPYVNQELATFDTLQSLATLGKGSKGVIEEVRDDATQLGENLLHEASGATVLMRLLELGFVVGEEVEVIAEVRPGGDPIAVRVGGSCFALRRREAAAVMVRLASRPLSTADTPATPI